MMASYVFTNSLFVMSPWKSFKDRRKIFKI